MKKFYGVGGTQDAPISAKINGLVALSSKINPYEVGHHSINSFFFLKCIIIKASMRFNSDKRR